MLLMPGTVTMLMVKGDQRSAAFRDRITNLKDYSNINVLPKVRAHIAAWQVQGSNKISIKEERKWSAW